MALRSSTKILIGAIVAGTLGYLGWRVVPAMMIMREKFSALEPGHVNIIGVDTNEGYRVVVANQVAQLLLGAKGGDFEAPDKGSGDDPESRRIPLRDMLRALQGDEEAMGKFVMTMNQISSASLPSYPIIWSSSDLNKALAPNSPLAAKLEQDMSIRLDGTPTKKLRLGAIQEGIVIESRVPVILERNGKETTVFGIVREEFRPKFMLNLDAQLAEKGNLTRDLALAYYMESAQKVLENPSLRENVRAAIQSRISDNRFLTLAELPQKLLRSITVVLNEDHILGGDYSAYEGNDGRQLYDMTLHVNEEGRKRLWQYSTIHRGEQLLIVWDGIAIAAPKIEQPIPFADVQIRQISDQGLIEDTLDSLKELHEKRKTQP